MEAKETTICQFNREDTKPIKTAIESVRCLAWKFLTLMQWGEMILEAYLKNDSRINTTFNKTQEATHLEIPNWTII